MFYNGKEEIVCLNGLKMIPFRFRKDIFHIIPNPFSGEFEQSFFPRPETEESRCGIRRGVDLFLLKVVHRVGNQRGRNLAGNFHVCAHGLATERTQGHVAGMAEAEVDVRMPGINGLPPAV